MRQYIGVDVGSVSSVGARCLEGQTNAERSTLEFSMRRDGFERLLNFIRQRGENPVVVFESTGAYWVPLAVFLVEHEVPFVTINPIRTKHFGKSRLERTKNDRVDARLLAAFGAREKVEGDASILEGRAFLAAARTMESFAIDRGRALQQLRELLLLVFPEVTTVLRDFHGPLARNVLRMAPSARAAILAGEEKLADVRVVRCAFGREKARRLLQVAQESMCLRRDIEPLERLLLVKLDILDSLDQAIAAAMKVLRALAPQEDMKLLQSIPGVGDKGAIALLAEIRDIRRFRRGDQLVKYVGVFPEERSSGMKGTPSTSWRMSCIGNARLRRLLFMMTLHAVKCNPTIRAYFAKKCAEGKSKMTALGHCMKKQLLLIRAVWRSGVPFDPAYHRAAG